MKAEQIQKINNQLENVWKLDQKLEKEKEKYAKLIENCDHLNEKGEIQISKRHYGSYCSICNKLLKFCKVCNTLEEV